MLFSGSVLRGSRPVSAEASAATESAAFGRRVCCEGVGPSRPTPSRKITSFMLNTFAELRRYFTAEDRRQWLLLLGTSLAAGLAQSFTLAIFNDAVATYGRGAGNLAYLPLVIG